MANKTYVTQKFYGIEYDFNKDGGAQGTIKTGLIIPAEGVVALGVVESIITCVGPGSSFSFGVAGNTGLYGSYGAIVYGQNNTFLIHASPVAKEVLITIAGADVAVGKLKISWQVIVSSGL